MKTPVLLPKCNIPTDGLFFFYRLMNWVEQQKRSKLHLIGWKIGQKLLRKLNCAKFKPDEIRTIPKAVAENTLYVPISSSGIYVIRQLRHAFCHNALSYDESTGLYEIEMTEHVKISGKFSLDALEEFVLTYIQISNQ